MLVLDHIGIVQHANHLMEVKTVWLTRLIVLLNALRSHGRKALCNSAGQVETIRQNVGTIDYHLGVATLTNLRIMSISGSSDYIVFYAPLSVSSNAYAEKDAIIFVDSNTSGSITG